MCVSLHLCAGTPRFLQFIYLFILLCFIVAAAESCVGIPPCLKLPSSLLCGRHNTTAVAQQVCADHSYACVGIAYAYVGCVRPTIRKHVACTSIVVTLT